MQLESEWIHSAGQTCDQYPKNIGNINISDDTRPLTRTNFTGTYSNLPNTLILETQFFLITRSLGIKYPKSAGIFRVLPGDSRPISGQE